MTPLGPVSIKSITTTTMTNFESKHSSYHEEWLLNPIIALFLCRGRGICRVMDRPKGDDDIKFSIDWFHNWIEAIKLKLPTQCLLRSTFASLNLIRLYNLKLPVFKFLEERTNHSAGQRVRNKQRLQTQWNVIFFTSWKSCITIPMAVLIG